MSAAVLCLSVSTSAVAGPFPAVVDLSTLDSSDGFVLRGIHHSDISGYAVAETGDVNGDGFGDLVIGAEHANPGDLDNPGETYVVFGHARLGARGAIELAGMTGENGFVLPGIAEEDQSGSAVSGAGDLNGDGFDDVLIAAVFADAPGYEEAGQAYVVFGAQQVGNGGSLPLASLDGSNGFILNGAYRRGEAGSGVSRAGDFNDDGYDDIIIGATWADPRGRGDAGQSYIIFGGPGVGSDGELTLTTVDGSDGFMINGVDIADFSGRSVSDAGDVNGDGIDDVIIGAPGADPDDIYDGGAAYVLFGHKPPFPPQFELSNIGGGNGFAVTCAPLRTECGVSVSALGDVNDDGYDDIIVGAPSGRTNGQQAGTSYVVFGGPGVGAGGSIGVLSLDGSNGFVLNGAESYDRSGFDVNRAGDINGDGVDDIVIGTVQDPFVHSGKAYVIYGHAGIGAGGKIELSEIDGSNGFVIVGGAIGDDAGRVVAPAGDVNDDGVDDLMVGAPGADPHGKPYAGETYVVFGRATDADADGIDDPHDNCTQVANADQRDTNGDGYGNVCDPDLDDNGIVNFSDLGHLKVVFLGSDADADFDGDGKVNFVDLGTMKSFFFLAPGPSGLVD